MSAQLAKNFKLKTYTIESGSSNTLLPFEINKIRTQGGFVTITVNPGTINNIIPNNIFEEFEVSTSGTYFVYIIANGITKILKNPTIFITSEELQMEAEKNGAPVNVYVKIGMVKDGYIYSFANGKSYWAYLTTVFKSTEDMVNIDVWTAWTIL